LKPLCHKSSRLDVVAKEGSEMTEILLAAGHAGQFFVDPVTGIQIGEMWE